MIDELVYYFLRMKSQDIHVNLRVEEGYYVAVLDCVYEREHRDEARSLERILTNQTRDKGIEEAYWELMGMNGSRQDTELQLVGMMVDEARVEIKESILHVELKKKI